MIAMVVLLLEVMLLSMLRTFGIAVDDVVEMALIFVFTGAFFCQMFSRKKNALYAAPLMLGYLFRLALLFLDLYGKNIYSLPNSGYDSEMYYRWAVEYVSTHNAGQGEVFSAVMGTIFSVIGSNRLFGQFIVMLFSIVSLCVMTQIISMFDSIKPAVKRQTTYIVSLLPNFAILSSIFLRESLIAMLITCSFYFFVRWMKRGNEANFLCSIVIALAASAIHGGSAAILIGYIAGRLIYDRKNNAVRMRLSNVIPVAFFVFVVAYLFVNYADTLFGKISNIQSLADIGNTNAEGGSSYAAYVGDSSSVTNMVIYTPLRIIYFLFSPFPWQWRGIADIIGFVFSALFYLVTIKNAIQYIRRRCPSNRNMAIIVLIVAMCTAFVFAWGVSNTGTATRHRDKMIVIYAVLYALTSARIKLGRNR